MERMGLIMLLFKLAVLVVNASPLLIGYFVVMKTTQSAILPI